MSREMKGIYKPITMEQIREYGLVPREFTQLLNIVYAENKGKIPLDVLASMMEIMSYDTFIRNYLKYNPNSKIEHGDLYRMMDVDIQEFEFSQNLKMTMLEYNILPYKVTGYEMIFITPEIDIIDYKDQTFTIFRRTLAEELEALDKRERIMRCSNKMFVEALHLIMGEQEYTDRDMEYLDEQRLQVIFIDAILSNATDIYIDPKKTGVNVSLGIFNEEIHYRKYTMTPTQRNKFLESIMRIAGQSPDKAEWSVGMKNLLVTNLAGLNNRYEGRLNIIDTQLGLASVMRVHDKQRTVQPFDDLKINSKPKAIIRRIIDNPSGIFLVSGAKGQGKSTTIYSCLEYLQRHRPMDRIEEISNPAEIYSEHISQLSIDEDKRIDYDLLLQASTRRNAKIIFMGEVNTAKASRFCVDIAIQETFLISSIHAGSTSLVPGRMKGMTVSDPGAYLQFMELVRGISHQTMLKKACPSCSKEIDKNELGSVKVSILDAYGYDRDTVLVAGNNRDCPTCGGNSYLVDKPIVCIDVIEITDDIRDKLRGGIDNPRTIIEDISIKDGTSGVHDAFEYLKRNELTFDLIYDSYALWNLREEILLSSLK